MGAGQGKQRRVKSNAKGLSNLYLSNYSFVESNLLIWTALDEHRWRDLTAIRGTGILTEGDAVLELRNQFSLAKRKDPCRPSREVVILDSDDEQRIRRALLACIHGDTELSDLQRAHAQQILGLNMS